MSKEPFQQWRAVAVARNGVEHLLRLGMSPDDIRKHYSTVYFEYLDDEERAGVRRIELQRWVGEGPRLGKWVSKGNLPIPLPDETTDVLPIPRPQERTAVAVA